MTEHNVFELLKSYWQVIAGVSATLLGVAKMWWWQHQRINQIHERMPPVSEGKILATKKHVDDCHERVGKRHDDKHAELVAMLADLNKRIDRIYEMLAGRKE